VYGGVGRRKGAGMRKKMEGRSIAEVRGSNGRRNDCETIPSNRPRRPSACGPSACVHNFVPGVFRRGPRANKGVQVSPGGGGWGTKKLPPAGIPKKPAGSREEEIALSCLPKQAPAPLL